jgi:transcriptional regulator with GAF, ATPase, and Fis domain
LASERGAFTGADRARQGRFRAAEGGTLFLDEVGELPTSAQGKLLRVLQERVVDVLGSDAPVAVDVRLVVATNRDLATEVAAGRFRQDLYFRLAVLEIAVPPLRERPEDIAVLARHFVEGAEDVGGRELEDELVAELARRPWLGNVRELQNAIERLVVLSPPSASRPPCCRSSAPSAPRSRRQRVPSSAARQATGCICPTMAYRCSISSAA